MRMLNTLDNLIYHNMYTDKLNEKLCSIYFTAFIINNHYTDMKLSFELFMQQNEIFQCAVRILQFIKNVFCKNSIS